MISVNKSGSLGTGLSAKRVAISANSDVTNKITSKAGSLSTKKHEIMNWASCKDLPLMKSALISSSRKSKLVIWRDFRNAATVGHIPSSLFVAHVWMNEVDGKTKAGLS